MPIIDATPDNITNAILWALCGLVVAMGGALVWVIKNNKKNGSSQEKASGELPSSYWEKHFERLEEKIDNSRDELIDSVRDLTKAINELTMTLLRGK